MLLALLFCANCWRNVLSFPKFLDAEVAFEQKLGLFPEWGDYFSQLLVNQMVIEPSFFHHESENLFVNPDSNNCQKEHSQTDSSYLKLLFTPLH